MAELVNRPAVGRIECLDYLILNLAERFGESHTFTLNDAKFSESRPNVHAHCKLLKREENLDIHYCPYFTNPLSKAGCALTNSLVEDTQKQKAVSNTINALHGLGLIERGSSTSTLTSLGKSFANLDFQSPEMSSVITEAVCQYGPLVGMLGEIYVKGYTKFSTGDISVGYPNSGDEITVGGNTVKISVGSQEDSNVRTRSVLLAWAVASGFIEPANWGTKTHKAPHLEFREYLLREKRADKFYIVTPKIKEFFSKSQVVSRPLDYEHLIKDVNALREKGQEQIRNETKKLVGKIRNRRFAIIYLLNDSFQNNIDLEFGKMVDFLEAFPLFFVIAEKAFRKVMSQELSIAFAAGIPFTLNGTQMHPLNGVSTAELCKDAPRELLEILKKYVH
jgi:hypothetical protein